MNERILIPLDGSPLAESVLPTAVSVARLRGYGVTLLHVIGPSRVEWLFPFNGMPFAGSREEHHLQAGAYLRMIQERLEAQGLMVNRVVDEGEPAEIIRHHADDNRVVRMVAMATHGRSGLRRLVLGSIADQVFRSLRKPLLLVRPTAEAPADEPRYRTILVPLDGAPIAAQALIQAQLLAEENNARLVLLGVLPEISDGLFGAESRPHWVAEYLADEERQLTEYLGKVAEQLRVTGLRVDTQVVYGLAADQIVRAAAAERADMIVMASRGRNGLSRLWHGSVTAEVAQSATLPLLLVNAAVSVPGTPL